VAEGDGEMTGTPPLKERCCHSTVEPFGQHQNLHLSGERIPRIPDLGPRQPAADHDRSNHQSFNLARSSRYIGRIAFRDQLDWTGAAWVLTATNFRRSE
jgi:hypothetical protein